MASDEEVNGFVAGILLAFVVVMLIKFVAGDKVKQVINCMPIIGNKAAVPVPKKKQENMDTLSPDNIMETVNRLKPKVSEDDPDWAKNYASITNKLLNQDYTKNPASVQYSKTRSACGWLQLNRDLRRVPIPKRDPTTVTSFYLPSIDTKCYAAMEAERAKRAYCN